MSSQRNQPARVIPKTLGEDVDCQNQPSCPYLPPRCLHTDIGCCRQGSNRGMLVDNNVGRQAVNQPTAKRRRIDQYGTRCVDASSIMLKTQPIVQGLALQPLVRLP